MRLKSFRAATVAEAMHQVRDHFGDNAVIVSTQRNPGGDAVRVTAAVEEPDAMEGAGGFGVTDIDAGTADAVDAIDVVSRTLDFHGLPSALADRLLGISSNLLLDDPAAALAVALDAAIKFEPLPAGTRPARPLMLVGPSGAGKTVTVAKLAVRAAFERLAVHVVTTDTMRAGGYDQLAAFTRLLKVELMQAENPEQLRDAVGEAPIDAVVLIDTMAANPFSDGDMGELAGHVGAVGAEPVLVLPGGLDIAEAREIGQLFRGIGCSRLLATRIDTTRRLGSIVNTACTARLKLCNYTHSPHVTQGLDKLNPLALARLMLPGIAAAGPMITTGAAPAGAPPSGPLPSPRPSGHPMHGGAPTARAAAAGATVDGDGRVEPAWAREDRPGPVVARPLPGRPQSAPVAATAPISATPPPTGGRAPPPRGAAGAYRAAPPSPAPNPAPLSKPPRGSARSPRPPPRPPTHPDPSHVAPGRAGAGIPGPADDDEAAAARLAAAIVAAADAGDPAGDPAGRFDGRDDRPMSLAAATDTDEANTDGADTDWAAALAEPIAGPLQTEPAPADASSAGTAEFAIGDASSGAAGGLVDAGVSLSTETAGSMMSMETQGDSDFPRFKDRGKRSMLNTGDGYAPVEDGHPDDAERMAGGAGRARGYAETDEDLLADDWIDPEEFDTDQDVAIASILDQLKDADFADPEASMGSEPDLDLAGLPKPVIASAGFEIQDEPEPDFDALRLNEEAEFEDDSATRDRRLSDTDRWLTNKASRNLKAVSSRIGKTSQ